MMNTHTKKKANTLLLASLVLGIALGSFAANVASQSIPSISADDHMVIEGVVCPAYEAPCVTDGCDEAPPQDGLWCSVAGPGCTSEKCVKE